MILVCMRRWIEVILMLGGDIRLCFSSHLTQKLLSSPHLLLKEYDSSSTHKSSLLSSPTTIPCVM